MSHAAFLVLALTALLALANGSNDVSKAVATLVGSGVADYRRAQLWGAAWAGAGGLVAAVAGGAMLARFGGGLLADGAQTTVAAALAVPAGAAGWVLLASFRGWPVSTTHAVVGALVGVGLFTHGAAGMAWNALAGTIVLPLLATPFLAMLASGGALWLGRCHAASRGSRALDAGRATGGGRTLRRLHWLTAGTTSFARGLNDAPKLVALMVVGSGLALGGGSAPTWAFFVVVATAMVAGGIVAGRRVTHVLAERVTSMDHREGFTVNLVTACLVTTGAVAGLPMATTHVASGGLFGAGLARRAIHAATVRDIILAWAITVPASAALAAAILLAVAAVTRS